MRFELVNNFCAVVIKREKKIHPRECGGVKCLIIQKN